MNSPSEGDLEGILRDALNRAERVEKRPRLDIYPVLEQDQRGRSDGRTQGVLVLLAVVIGLQIATIGLLGGLLLALH